MFLGIDLGTTSLKVVLMNDAQEIIACHSHHLRVSRPQALWSEQNPEDWWQACDEAIQHLSQAHPKEFAHVKAIGLSGQMHGATLLDQKQRVLRPAILWNDGRSMAECEWLTNNVDNINQIVGNLVMPGFTAPKLLWVQRYEPDIFQRIDKVLLPKDYLRLRMSGDFATDLSDAAGTCWLNIGQRDWADEMLDACQLSREHMPKLYEGNQITGCVTEKVASRWGLPSRTPIVAGGGDNAASAISMNVIQPGRAFLSLGTSGVYFVSQQSYQPNVAQAVHTFCHCLPDLWHQMTVHLSSASALQWYAGTLKQDNFDTLLREAERQARPGKVIFLPYLSGERSPHNDPYARGVFFGLSHDTTHIDLTQAVLEGVAFSFAQGQAAMLTADNVIDEVTVVGGGARSLYWGKIIATALNRPLTYRRVRDVGAALGAAKLAWLAIAGGDARDVLIQPEIEQIIEPDTNLQPLYQDKLALFTELYQKVKPLYRMNI